MQHDPFLVELLCGGRGGEDNGDMFNIGALVCRHGGGIEIECKGVISICAARIEVGVAGGPIWDISNIIIDFDRSFFNIVMGSGLKVFQAVCRVAKIIDIISISAF